MFKATVEVGDKKITIEGPRDFVEEQIAKLASQPLAKPGQPMLGSEPSNLTAEQPITEKDLIQAKQPKGHLETVAVLAFALTQAGPSEFTEEDVRRAYLRAGVRPPKVIAQAIRDTKNRLDYIEPGEKRGTYRLSPHGDRTVRFDLPRR